MTSLSEVYADARNESLRRLYLGTGMFVVGACLVVIAIVVATTTLGQSLGLGTYAARELAGVFAGLGVPAVFVGIFTVLPASARERAAAAIGASIAVFGVVLFSYAYPERWLAAPTESLALPTGAVYFLGTITTFWSLFTAVVNFKTRNEPGGTVTLKRTIGGETEVIEVPRSELQDGDLGDASALGGVGVLGDVDRNTVMSESGSSTAGSGSESGPGEPSTGDDAEFIDAPDDRSSRGRGASGGSDRTTPASDGGTTANEIRTPGPRVDPDRSDRYCGNCSAFEYVRTAQGMQPYCGVHDEVMDDMDPCEQWEPRR